MFLGDCSVRATQKWRSICATHHPQIVRVWLTKSAVDPPHPAKRLIPDLPLHSLDLPGSITPRLAPEHCTVKNAGTSPQHRPPRGPTTSLPLHHPSPLCTLWTRSSIPCFH